MTEHRHQETLDTIARLTEELGHPPTLQAVADVMVLTRERVRQLANKLRAKGLLEPGKHLILPGCLGKKDSYDQITLEIIRNLNKTQKVPVRLNYLAENKSQLEISWDLDGCVKRLKEKGLLHKSQWLVESSQPEFTYEDYFWSFVDVRGEDECWEWLGGCIHPNGYGHTGLTAKEFDGEEYAHRIAYMLSNNLESLGTDKWVYIKCTNKSCCNPNHMVHCLPSEWTSHKICPRWWSSKPVLSSEDARRIKNLAASGKSVNSIYMDFQDQCTYGTVLSIARGNTYKHA